MIAQTTKFIKFIRDDCKKYNTFLVLTRWKSIKDKEDDIFEKIEGFFDTPRRNKKGKIKIATGVPKTVWLHTLAHEYAHFEYWKKNNAFRKNYILTVLGSLSLLKTIFYPYKIKKKKSKKNSQKKKSKKKSQKKNSDKI